MQELEEPSEGFVPKNTYPRETITMATKAKL
jgi:hypothetical protein